MKKIILTFIVAALSFTKSHAQNPVQTLSDANTLLILFAPTASSAFIEATRIRYNATEIKKLPNTDVRIWYIPLPVIIGIDTLRTIIEISDHASSNTVLIKSAGNHITPIIPPIKKDTSCFNCMRRTIAPNYDNDWANNDICVAGTRQIIVAITDCGLSDIRTNGTLDNTLHNGLFNNKIWKNTSESSDALDNDRNGYVNDFIGWNWVDNDNLPIDNQRWSHGTYVNGVVAKILNQAHTSNVKIMNLKTQDAYGNGSLRSLIEAIDYAMGKNVKVMNLSLSYVGKKADAPNSILKAVIDIAGQKNDMLFVVAAGNNAGNLDATTTTTAAFPAYFNSPNMIVVAADSLGQRASFSNYGRISVDIAAPGFEVYSTIRGRDAWEYVSGTSVAAPFVTATAALLGTKMNWNSNTIKNIILNTATIPAGNTWNGLTVSKKILNIPAALGCRSHNYLDNFAKSNNGVTEAFAGLEAFPNPFTETTQLKIITEKDDEAILTIQNAYGQVVLNQKMACRQGENIFEWVSNEVIKGMYVVKVQFANQTLTQKIIKQ